MKLNTNTINRLNTLVNDGYVKRQTLSDGNYIYKYTAATQYERLWDDVTTMCRGLVLNEVYDIVARPFTKFFNIQEVSEFPKGNYQMYEKLDGSLGICYFFNNKWNLVTQGSDVSEQAVVGNGVLQNKYSEYLHRLDKDYTYLFEIIYPENLSSVCKYDYTDIVLLGIIHTQTGQEIDIYDDIVSDLPFPKATKFDMNLDTKDLISLVELNESNKEGYVIKFDNNYRIKVKFDEYVKLHKQLNNLTSTHLWEYLKDGKDISELLEIIPDEVYDSVRNFSQNILDEFNKIHEEITNQYKLLCVEDRKQFALRVMSTELVAPKAAYFNLYDGKEIKKIVFDMIKPSHYKII